MKPSRWTLNILAVFVIFFATRTSGAQTVRLPGPGPAGLLSAGTVSLALSGLYALLARDALARCAVQHERAVCPSASALTVAQLADGDFLIANVALGVGITALAAGAVWWALTPAPRAPRLSVSAGPSGGFLSVSGTF